MASSPSCRGSCSRATSRARTIDPACENDEGICFHFQCSDMFRRSIVWTRSSIFTCLYLFRVEERRSHDLLQPGPQLAVGLAAPVVAQRINPPAGTQPG